MDFSIHSYRKLLDAFQTQGYHFQTYRDFCTQPASRVVLLRHDVDNRNLNSLALARIQHEKGIKGTYYFRVSPQSFSKEIIAEINSLGHEIGYHYEDLDLAKGDPVKAIQLFENHLERFREIVMISTICMHGSPLSKYDNRDIWKHYDYRDYGIVAEPYFDLDFRKVLYLTDTGRRWDGDSMIIRDKAGDPTINRHIMSKEKLLSDVYQFRRTDEIIQACVSGNLPDQIMINFHPQRWSSNPASWTRELLIQNFKNMVKYVLKGYMS